MFKIEDWYKEDLLVYLVVPAVVSRKLWCVCFLLFLLSIVRILVGWENYGLSVEEILVCCFFLSLFFVFSQFFHIIIACEETMVFVSLIIVCFLVAGVVFIFFFSPLLVSYCLYLLMYLRYHCRNSFESLTNLYTFLFQASLVLFQLVIFFIVPNVYLL